MAAAVLTAADLVPDEHVARAKPVAGRALLWRVRKPAAIRGLDELADAGHNASVGPRDDEMPPLRRAGAFQIRGGELEEAEHVADDAAQSAAFATATAGVRASE